MNSQNVTSNSSNNINNNNNETGLHDVTDKSKQLADLDKVNPNKRKSNAITPNNTQTNHVVQTTTTATQTTTTATQTTTAATQTNTAATQTNTAPTQTATATAPAVPPMPAPAPVVLPIPVPPTAVPGPTGPIIHPPGGRGRGGRGRGGRGGRGRGGRIPTGIPGVPAGGLVLPVAPAPAAAGPAIPAAGPAIPAAGPVATVTTGTGRARKEKEAEAVEGEHSSVDGIVLFYSDLLKLDHVSGNIIDEINIVNSRKKQNYSNIYIGYSPDEDHTEAKVNNYPSATCNKRVKERSLNDNSNVVQFETCFMIYAKHSPIKFLLGLPYQAILAVTNIEIYDSFASGKRLATLSQITGANQYQLTLEPGVDLGNINLSTICRSNGFIGVLQVVAANGVVLFSYNKNNSVLKLNACDEIKEEKHREFIKRFIKESGKKLVNKITSKNVKAPGFYNSLETNANMNSFTPPNPMEFYKESDDLESDTLVANYGNDVLCIYDIDVLELIPKDDQGSPMTDAEAIIFGKDCYAIYDKKSGVLSLSRLVDEATLTKLAKFFKKINGPDTSDEVVLVDEDVRKDKEVREDEVFDEETPDTGFVQYETDEDETLSGTPNTDLPSSTQPDNHVPSSMKKPAEDVPSSTKKPVEDVPSSTKKPVEDVPSSTKKPVEDVPSSTKKPVEEIPSSTPSGYVTTVTTGTSGTNKSATTDSSTAMEIDSSDEEISLVRKESTPKTPEKSVTPGTPGTPKTPQQPMVNYQLNFVNQSQFSAAGNITLTPGGASALEALSPGTRNIIAEEEARDMANRMAKRAKLIAEAKKKKEGSNDSQGPSDGPSQGPSNGQTF